MLRPDDHALPVERRRDAVGNDVLDCRMPLAMFKPALGRRVHDRARNRVRKVLFETGGKTQDLVFFPAVERQHARYLRRRFGEGARLVEHHRVRLCDGLEMLRSLHGEAKFGALAHSRKRRDGTGQLERARIVHHEGCCRFRKAAGRKRHHARQQEVPRHYLVGKARHTLLAFRLQALGLFDQPDDRAQFRAARCSLDADEGAAFFDGSAREHVVANSALYRKRFAGQRRLVDHDRALHHRAIDADRHAGANGDKVAGRKLAGMNRHLFPVHDFLGSLGQIEQRAYQLVLRASARVLLHSLAHVEQQHGLACSTRVATHEGKADSRHVQYRHIQPAVR